MTPTHQTLRALAEAALAHLTPQAAIGLLDRIAELEQARDAHAAVANETGDRCSALRVQLAAKEQECERWKAAAIRLQGAVYEWRQWSDEVAPPFGSARDRSDKGQRDAIITDMADLRSALAEACDIAGRLWDRTASLNDMSRLAEIRLSAGEKGTL